MIDFEQVNAGWIWFNSKNWKDSQSNSWNMKLDLTLDWKTGYNFSKIYTG